MVIDSVNCFQKKFVRMAVYCLCFNNNVHQRMYEMWKRGNDTRATDTPDVGFSGIKSMSRHCGHRTAKGQLGIRYLNRVVK